MTRGDHYNLACPHPHCGKNNNHLCREGRIPEFGKVLIFAYECWHCKRKFYVAASWEIATVGECIDPRGAERPEASA